MRAMNISETRNTYAGGYLEIKCRTCGKQYVYLPYLWKTTTYYKKIANMNTVAKKHQNSMVGQLAGCKWYDWYIAHS